MAYNTLKNVQQLDEQPWYRQAWPWFLISLPASAVIGGIITFILAVQSPNAMVVDDYYKEGLAINHETRRLQAATNRSLEGLLRAGDKQLTLVLNSTVQIDNDQVTLDLIHATRAELDLELTMIRNGASEYTTPLPTLVAGNWYLRVRPDALDWEIRTKVHIDGLFQTRLTGNGR